MQNQSLETIETKLNTVFSWAYEPARKELQRLYEMGKRDQWNGTFHLDWSLPVDLEDPRMFPPFQVPIYGSDIWDKMTPREQHECVVENVSWILSQFLHGEQGALLATSQIVSVVPLMEAKLYGSTQVVDEGRHVEVFSRYLREKIQRKYAVNDHLAKLLNSILSDSRWDVKYLGMQVLVEGLALGAFGLIRNVTEEPLMRELLYYVMKDEARHVAFGVLSLKDVYDEMMDGERKEREEFAYEACVIMRDRFLAQQVWENLGLPVERCCQYALECQAMKDFRVLLFSKVIPNLKRIGLLPERMRRYYEELGVLQFEDFEVQDLAALEKLDQNSVQQAGLLKETI